jgi:hypothetical protein
MRRLVNIPTRTDTPAGSTGIFLTPQSLVAFPVASAVVTVVWKVLSGVFPAWGPSRITLLVVAGLVGALIYTISETARHTPKDRIISVAIAVLNSFFLAASALGIDVVTG